MSFDVINLSERSAARSGAGEQAAGRFPGSIDRFQRALGRFRRKLGILTRLNAAALLVLAAAAYALAAVFSRSTADGSLSWGETVAAAIIAVLGLVLLAGIRGAVAAAAAFKINDRKALSVGFSRLLPWLTTEFLAAAAVFFGGLAFVIPGLILKLRFSLAMPVILAEQRQGADALARSRNLVYGRTAALFIGVTALTAALLAVGAVFFLPAFLLSHYYTPPAPPWLDPAVSKWLFVLFPAVVVTILLSPMIQIFLQIFYEDAVGRLGQTEPAGALPAQRYGRFAAAGAALIVLTALGAAAAPFIISKGGPTLLGGGIGAETPAPPQPPPEPTAEDRDWERYRDMNVLRLALNSYMNAKGGYPDKMEDMVPAHLKQVPLDPATELPYAYARTAAAYKIVFELEQGVLILAPGRHVLSPKGFDIPEQAERPPAPPPPEPKMPPTDTDNDGLSDDAERSLGTDPEKADTDGDGLTDRDEVELFKTSPMKPDTDGDGFGDGDEIYSGFNPLVKSGKLNDTDRDGLADIYETSRSLDPDDPDMDRDGLADGDELRIFGTDPRLADTDHDGYSDSDELRRNFEPLGSGQIEAYRRAEIDLKTGKYGLHSPTSATLKP